jgi:hypothetical protein
MRSEFDLAKQKGLHLIPVGASGGITADLWEEVMNNFDAFFPAAKPNMKASMAKLGEKTDKPQTLLKPLLELINLLASGM